MQLRPYQLEALDKVMADLRQKPYVLLQIPTGGGKTVVFSEIIRRWMTEYPAMTIAVAAHRQELITQARDKLLTVWPEGAFQIGLACAGAGRVDTSRPVLIGSVQTLARRALRRPIHLLIVDEAHRIPAVEAGGQYHSLIRRLVNLNPNLRVLGCTATPFRLGHGYIYGDECKAGRTNIFPELNFQISLEELTAEGHLAPIRAKEGASIGSELARVKLTNGDYDPAELNSLLMRGVHIQSAVDAYEKYGESRNKVLVFAASIEHAEKLAAAFGLAGHQAAAVHSQMADHGRKMVLRDFDQGGLKVLVNVGILTEGWDSPRVNLIMMCRPTKAPALFVQMIGRGTRLFPGKDDLLVLDLAENYKTHGEPSAPAIRTPGQGGGEAPFKVCPECSALLPTSSLRCRDCGHQWEVWLVDEEVAPPMVEVKRPPAGLSRVVHWDAEGYVSQKGHYLLRLKILCRPGGEVKSFLDLEGAASVYGRQKARALWWQLSGGKEPPATVREAAARAGELRLPEFVTVAKKGNYKIIKELS